MPGLIDSVKLVIHDASAGLIDKQITTKVSDAVTGVVATGFEIVGDVLTIVKDLTEQSNGS